MGKLLGAWTRDYLRGVVLYVVVAAIVIPSGCVCIFVPRGFVPLAGFMALAILSS